MGRDSMQRDIQLVRDGFSRGQNGLAQQQLADRAAGKAAFPFKFKDCAVAHAKLRLDFLRMKRGVHLMFPAIQALTLS